MSSDVTKTWIAFMDVAGMTDRDGGPMKFDLFKDAAWRRKIADPAIKGTVTVTLSTGKTVKVNSKLLGLLRILADELAKNDPRLN